MVRLGDSTTLGVEPGGVGTASPAPLLRALLALLVLLGVNEAIAGRPAAEVATDVGRLAAVLGAGSVLVAVPFRPRAPALARRVGVLAAGWRDALVARRP